MQYHPYGRPLWIYDEGNHILGDPNNGPLLDIQEIEDPAERSIEDTAAVVRAFGSDRPGSTTVFIE